MDPCIILQFIQKIQQDATLFNIHGSVHRSMTQLTTSNNYTSDNLPRMQNQRLLVQF